MTVLLPALREQGVRVAVDDFGTGYSSLAYLRHLPVDILKIDRAFTPEGRDAPRRPAFTRAIVELGDSLRPVVDRRGGRDAEQAARLRELGCPLAQGYHFSRPLPAEDLNEVPQRRQRHPARLPTAPPAPEDGRRTRTTGTRTPDEGDRRSRPGAERTGRLSCCDDVTSPASTGTARRATR